METILRQTRVISPVPSRPTLIALIEAETLEGWKLTQCWMVYEDSFHAWVRTFQPDSWKLLPSKPILAA